MFMQKFRLAAFSTLSKCIETMDQIHQILRYLINFIAINDSQISQCNSIIPLKVIANCPNDTFSAHNLKP